MRQFRVYDGSVVIEEGEVEMTWEQVRQIRDKELAASDWRALKDVVLPNAWKEFRDLLRTLPQRFEDPNDAADNFPEAPSDE